MDVSAELEEKRKERITLQLDAIFNSEHNEMFEEPTPLSLLLPAEMKTPLPTIAEVDGVWEDVLPYPSPMWDIPWDSVEQWEMRTTGRDRLKTKIAIQSAKAQTENFKVFNN